MQTLGQRWTTSSTPPGLEELVTCSMGASSCLAVLHSCHRKISGQ
uniref:Uncharacterized protein n=1 Tax=Anguilla anguilla TaxID=7936 RepID=A0A0E9VT78_ANGAN